MAFWLIVLVLLIIAAALLLVPVLRQPQRDLPEDRDRLNTRFYHQRLKELEQDEEQGVVAERQVMIEELQQNLLSDVPDAQAERAEPLNRWVLLPGVVILVLISVGFYLKTGGLAQVQGWNLVMSEMPSLRERVMNEDKQPLTMEEIARLGLGLRTELQTDPRNVADWVMLGRIGMALNNATTATQAFSHAYQLAPNEPEVALGYAEVLTRSNDPEDNKQAADMLGNMMARNHQDVRVLSLLAFNAFEQGDYKKAIGAWEMMLRVLPENDSRREVLKRSIEQAKAQSGEDNTQLSVTINLSPDVERQLPPTAVLVVSVTDGVAPIPVAVKQLPLGHFPVKVSLSDANAMMPERLLSAQKQVKVRARISRDGLANPQPGDWFGESAVMPYNKESQISLQIDHQVP
ncbi:c-type cytochrome biogenesis protein CcmI [Hafnia alvei]|uniref:Cytochrome c-type biogenesis protein CcmI n=1 Tax=Hafnia alvei TaxID=569 RepID=A0A1C6Z7K7_HAFAL|nr:c-type cytochrome biogenesis protein CcmI [Hafnia alvei]NLS52266.1 c-type cytochrome biogenesis protein CcmI [Hafnia alvei]SCM55054.1 cytochrome c-type biogenesis protein CcmI [Hafnia alvei]